MAPPGGVVEDQEQTWPSQPCDLMWMPSVVSIVAAGRMSQTFLPYGIEPPDARLGVAGETAEVGATEADAGAVGSLTEAGA